MSTHFFPNLGFGWVFCSALFFGLGIIAVKDLRTAKIPNNLSVSLTVLGLILNLIRGGWLAAHETEVWQLGNNGIAVGIIDAFLFSLTGFLVAFTLYFVMYVLGVCGGGDVKLMSAVGAWIGSLNICLVIPLTVVTLMIWVLFKVMSGGWKKTVQESKTQRQLIEQGKPLPKGRMTFTIPALVAVTLLLLWTYRVELHLVEQPENPHASVPYRIPC
jgi:Flp pilus assembly protein protease CpaA